jgi:hypothetical protein
VFHLDALVGDGEGALLLVGEELLLLALDVNGVNGVRPDGFSPLQALKNNAPTATITDRDTTERPGVIYLILPYHGGGR